MRRLFLLIVISFFCNSSSCELECVNCLEVYLSVVSEEENTRLPIADFPFHSIVNLESNQKLWSLDIFGEQDTILFQRYDYMVLPLHPDRASSFDFRDVNDLSIGTLTFEVDFEVQYSSDCKDYELRVIGEPIIEGNIQNVDIIVNSELLLPCLPILEIHL